MPLDDQAISFQPQEHAKLQHTVGVYTRHHAYVMTETNSVNLYIQILTGSDLRHFEENGSFQPYIDKILGGTETHTALSGLRDHRHSTAASNCGKRSLHTTDPKGPVVCSTGR